MDKTEQRYKDFINDIPLMVCSFELSGEITFVNRAYCDWFNQHYRDLIGKSFFETIPENERVVFESKISELDRSKPTFKHKYKILLPNQKEGWQSWTIRAFFSADGAIESFQSTGENITIVQGSNATDLELQLKALIGNLPGVAFQCLNDKHWTMLFLSDRCEALFGYSVDTLINNEKKAYSQLIEPEFREYIWSTVQSSIDKNKPYKIIYKIRKRNGELRWVEEQGKVSSVCRSVPIIDGYIEDVTERVEADIKLSQTAAVFRSTSEGVIIVDKDGLIVDVNEAFTTITGFTKSEVIGGNPSILQSGRHSSSFYKSMWKSLKENGHWHGEIWNRSKSGTVYPEMLTINAIDFQKGKSTTGYVGVFADITSIKETEARLNRLAHYDVLTGLPNRQLFRERLIHSLGISIRKKTKVAVLFLDLDRFKNVNDTLGHSAGDRLLSEAATRMRHIVRVGDTVGRISGDEFCLILEDIQNLEDLVPIVEKIISVFEKPIILGDDSIRISASIGIALSPDNSLDADSLLSFADSAMYEAKEAGRNTYKFYTADMTQQALEHSFVQSALRDALEQSQFFVVFQPQLKLSDLSIIGLEALLRWNHPERGLIPPDSFIPIAEKSGLIRDLGAWVLQTACEQCKKLLVSESNFGRLYVNVSAAQLHDDSFLRIVQDCLNDTGFPPENLGLEVTESFIMKDPKHAIGVLSCLKDMGIALAVDDFGTGYSSLSYLKALPLDKLKIDYSFIRDIPSDPNDMAITEAIIAMGKALNLSVIAEGVETSTQADFLLEKGCSEVQGFLFSKPLIANDLLEWMDQQRT